MNTNCVRELSVEPAAANAAAVAEICRNYKNYPVPTCQYLLNLRGSWAGTLRQFLEKAEELTCVKQAQVYRILRMQQFIDDFGELPINQQPSWSFLRLLKSELPRGQRWDAWMTAVWANGGTSNGLTRKVLRLSIDEVKLMLKKRVA